MTGSNPTDDAVIVALGGNLAGGRATVQDLLEAAVAGFPGEGLAVRARSRWWRSLAWPDADQPPFLNGVVEIETTLAPFELLSALLAIEGRFGRRRSEPNAARTLDLDLIAYGRRVLHQPGLILPHPRAHQRRFVMGPLTDIAPDWVHPALGRTAAALLGETDVGVDAAPA